MKDYAYRANSQAHLSRGVRLKRNFKGVMRVIATVLIIYMIIFVIPVGVMILSKQ